MTRKTLPIHISGTITALLLSLFISLSIHAAKSPDYAKMSADELYKVIDGLVGRHNEIVEAKERQIASIKSRLRQATTPSERYIFLSQLYNEYSTFNPDSALHYADMAYAISDHSTAAFNTWTINKADIYSMEGLFAEAQSQLDKIDRKTVGTSLLPNYFNSYQYLYSHKAVFARDDKPLARSFDSKAIAYNDSIGKYLTPDHPYSIWWEVVKADGKPIKQASYDKLKKYVETSGFDSRNDAIAAYWLGRAAESKGDTDGHARYLLLSALADINIANCDIASLEEIANDLYGKGEIDRAYNYADYCASMARLYHNRIRIFSIAELQDKLHGAYIDTIKAQITTIDTQKHRLTLFLVLACSLLLISVISIFFVVLLLRRYKKRGRQLQEANDALHQKIDELDRARIELNDAHTRQMELNKSLARANDDLQQANQVKQQYIMYAFSMASDFINDVDSLLKKMLRKVKTSQYGELRNELENPRFLSGEMKKFYSTFDRMFLSIYPSFIDEINAGLPDDEKVELKDGELPNTRLRIHALRKLGITESSKIAKMLRCSIQTVYNNRPKNSQ